MVITTVPRPDPGKDYLTGVGVMKEQKKESLLDNLCIAAPCSISWEGMPGDNRKRECGGCSRSVFNISDMTKAEAERFLRENTEAPPCMIFYRRHDGTIMTDNCPVGLRKSPLPRLPPFLNFLRRYERRRRRSYLSL